MLVGSKRKKKGGNGGNDAPAAVVYQAEHLCLCYQHKTPINMSWCMIISTDDALFIVITMNKRGQCNNG